MAGPIQNFHFAVKVFHVGLHNFLKMSKTLSSNESVPSSKKKLLF